MTKKRFQYNVNKNCIEYDGKFVAYLNSIDGFRIANYWNGLYKENEQLKETIETQNFNYKNAKGIIHFSEHQIQRLQDENKQLGIDKQNWYQQESKIRIKLHQLMEENEKLKQRNDKQAKQLDRLYHLIEEKDWKTLTDILDDFKRCDEQLQKEWGTYGDVE